MSSGFQVGQRAGIAEVLLNCQHHPILSVWSFPFHHNCKDKRPPDLPVTGTQAACDFILMCFAYRLLFKSLRRRSRAGSGPS